MPESQLPQNPGITHPDLNRLYEVLYERKLGIYQASADHNPDVDPSEFICSGGPSTYFEQPVDPEKREMLDDLYRSISLARHALRGWVRMPIEDVFYSEQLDWELSLRRELLQNTEYRRAIDGTVWSTVPQFLQDATGTGRYSMRTYDDFEHATNRMKGFGLWAEIALRAMREGITHDDTMPQILGARALRSIAGYRADASQTLRRALMEPLDATQVSGDFRRVYERTVEDRVLATLGTIHDFLRDEYLPNCRTNDEPGLFYAPDGQAQYERLLRYHTSDETSIDTMEAVAHEDYRTSLDQLTRLARKLDFSSPAALRKFLLSETAPHPDVRPFTTIDEILDRYQCIAERVQQGLPNIFFEQDMPSPDWRILPVTDHTASMTPATYSNGVFRMPVVDVTGYNAANTHKLFLHEVNPGHHVQLGGLTRTSQPKFLQYSNYIAVREGWAMYAETLADEIGAPYGDWEMAARLCSKVSTSALSTAEIGVHYRGWSLQQARAFVDEHIPGNDQSQEDLFLLRNISMPAQNHSYVYGEAMMHDMRRAAEIQMGNNFDARIFHNVLLGSGERPLSILRDYVFLQLQKCII